jgi:hypothetical protein
MIAEACNFINFIGRCVLVLLKLPCICLAGSSACSTANQVESRVFITRQNGRVLSRSRDRAFKSSWARHLINVGHFLLPHARLVACSIPIARRCESEL